MDKGVFILPFQIISVLFMYLGIFCYPTCRVIYFCLPVSLPPHVYPALYSPSSLEILSSLLQRSLLSLSSLLLFSYPQQLVTAYTVGSRLLKTHSPAVSTNTKSSSKIFISAVVSFLVFVGLKGCDHDFCLSVHTHHVFIIDACLVWQTTWHLT